MKYKFNTIVTKYADSNFLSKDIELLRCFESVSFDIKNTHKSQHLSIACSVLDRLLSFVKIETILQFRKGLCSAKEVSESLPVISVSINPEPVPVKKKEARRLNTQT